ncbi:DUF6962 family protein [Petrachloros mirabilis]
MPTMFTEPSTMVTDYALAVLCSLFAWRLWREGKDASQASMCSWAAGLACLGVASLAGGTFHGFSMLLSHAVLRALWKITVYAIGSASFVLLTGTLWACVLPSVRRFLSLIPTVQLMVYALWMVTHDDFRYVIYNYAFTYLSILGLQLHAGATQGARSAPWLVGGVLVSFVAAGVQANEMALHRHFNHNDLYHVIQMGGIYLFYRGAHLLKDR